MEGPLDTGRDYRLMRYATKQLRLPQAEEKRSDDDPELLPTRALLGDVRPEAGAQLHARIAPPLLALAFALMAVPLSRTSPRQGRYGHILIGFLAYLIGMDLMLLGTDWLADGKVPVPSGCGGWCCRCSPCGWMYRNDAASAVDPGQGATMTPFPKDPRPVHRTRVLVTVLLAGRC